MLSALLGKTLRLALPLYLSTLLLGLIPTTVIMLGLGSMAGDRPWRGDLLGPGWLNVVVEMLMEAIYTRGAPGLPLVVVGSVLLLPLALLLQLVAYSFLAGGILEAFSQHASPRLSFWAACRRWFWPFLRLSLLGGVIYAVVVVAVAALASLGQGLIGPEIGLLLQLAVQAILLGWLELARAIMVARSTRSVGGALKLASRMAARPLALLTWLVLALPSGGLLLAAILPPASDNPYTITALIEALAFGQTVAFLGAWTRVIRLAVATRLAQGARTASPAPVLTARSG